MSHDQYFHHFCINQIVPKNYFLAGYVNFLALYLNYQAILHLLDSPRSRTFSRRKF